MVDVLGKNNENHNKALLALDRVPAPMWHIVTPQLFSYLTDPQVHYCNAYFSGTCLQPSAYLPHLHAAC